MRLRFQRCPPSQRAPADPVRPSDTEGCQRRVFEPCLITCFCLALRDPESRGSGMDPDLMDFGCVADLTRETEGRDTGSILLTRGCNSGLSSTDTTSVTGIGSTFIFHLTSSIGSSGHR